MHWIAELLSGIAMGLPMLNIGQRQGKGATTQRRTNRKASRRAARQRRREARKRNR